MMVWERLERLREEQRPARPHLHRDPPPPPPPPPREEEEEGEGEGKRGDVDFTVDFTVDLGF